MGTSGQCINANNYCVTQLGTMSNYNSSLNKCECDAGYQFNGSSCVYKNINNLNINTPSLPSTPVKSNDEICADKFGQSWKWDGTKNNGGGLNCGCINNYTQVNGECVLKPIAPTLPPMIKNTPEINKVKAPVVKKEETESEKKINDDICKSRDPNSYYYGKLYRIGFPACGCVSGYERSDKTTDLCINQTIKDTLINQDIKPIDNIQNNEEIKPKSLWSKIKGLFGF